MSQDKKHLCAFSFTDEKVERLETFKAAGADANFVWEHFDATDGGLQAWLRESLPDIAARALTQSETRPRCDRLGDGVILNLRGVNVEPGGASEDMVSLRLWIAPGRLISSQMRVVHAIDEMRDAAERNEGPKQLGPFVAELVYRLAKRIESVTLEIEDLADDADDRMLRGRAGDTPSLGRLRQKTIKLRRFLAPQREAIGTLAEDGKELLGEEACQHIRETANRTRRSLEELDAARDRLTAIHDHQEAQRAHAMARNSYLLSAVAVIFLPLGFLTGLFGANVAGVPGAEAPHAFWILGLSSVVFGLVVFLLLKMAKWL